MSTEHAALVALRARPKKLTWRKLTNQVLQAGSAGAVWSHLNPDELIPSHEVAAALTEAEADLQNAEVEVAATRTAEMQDGYVEKLSRRDRSSKGVIEHGG